jgi:hypothetical protein
MRSGRFIAQHRRARISHRRRPLCSGSQPSLLYAEIIVGSIYAMTAAGLFVGLIATRGRSSTASLASAAGSGIARNAQVAMIVEALMLGYMLANKSGSRRQ